MSDSQRQQQHQQCTRCGTILGAGMLACPSCAKLVYADTLQSLAKDATEAEAANDRMKALALWRNALSLLPPTAGQRKTIEATVARLESAPAANNEDDAAIQKRSAAWKKWLGGLAPALAFLFTKGKFLILGLTKLPTLASMFLFVSVYWETWGWAFAVGLVLSIYLHEMGHMIMFRHYGIASSNPFFIPGFGAIIFAKQKIEDPKQDAHIGLGGPAAGLVAVLICLALYPITGNKMFLALTVFGAVMNLFNLIPILFLDGSHALRGLSTKQRWIIAGVALACSLAFSSKVALGVALVLAGRMLFWKKQESESTADTPTFALFAFLLVSLSGLSAINAPTPEELRPPKPGAVTQVR
jgi:Zn-dependent protease